jgi:hypothetical protein
VRLVQGQIREKTSKKNEADKFSCHDLLHFRLGWKSTLESDPLACRICRHPAGSRASLPHVEEGFEVIPFSI